MPKKTLRQQLEEEKELRKSTEETLRIQRDTHQGEIDKVQTYWRGEVERVRENFQQTIDRLRSDEAVRLTAAYQATEVERARFEGALTTVRIFVGAKQRSSENESDGRRSRRMPPLGDPMLDDPFDDDTFIY